MNTYEFNSQYGKYEIVFDKTSYVFGGLAIEVYDRDEDYWEPYGTLTKNLGDFLPDNCAYLDTNNLPDLVEFVLDNEWAELVGIKDSGYCTYPLARFTDEFLEEICI